MNSLDKRTRTKIALGLIYLVFIGRPILISMVFLWYYLDVAMYIENPVTAVLFGAAIYLFIDVAFFLFFKQK